MAAERGNATAQSNLGLMYYYGQCVPQDNVQTLMWFNLAAAKGNDIARQFVDFAASTMTAAEISEAQRLARDWLDEYGE